MSLIFDVPGLPQPKGSTRAFAHRATGRIVVTADNLRTRPWAAQITAAAREACRDDPEWPAPAYDPVDVLLTFRMRRPPSLPRRQQAATRKPDLDKLVRTVLDALTGVVWVDDAQVVSLSAVKVYAAPTDSPGVMVFVRRRPAGRMSP